ncbi:MAG: N,N-dimethylformamidase beta subunit family domain-containing protein [Acidimicrobiales bacterium]
MARYRPAHGRQQGNSGVVRPPNQGLRSPEGRRRTHARRRRSLKIALLGVLVLVSVAAGAEATLGGAKAQHGAPARAARGKHPRGSGALALSATFPGPHGPVARWVQKENAKPGTSAWRLTQPATAQQIEGYADKVSIEVGGTVELYVSTTAPSYQVQAFRMGYYGGALGRLVWTSATLPGMIQPTCPVLSPTNTVECSWESPVPVVTTGAQWPQGDYLFKLTASTGWQTYVPLTIRFDASHSAYVINNSVTTWQAYNSYGGYSLYAGATPSGGAALANRSRIVSFDRPYGFGNGSGDFIGLELPMVMMAESMGLDVSYTTDVNVSQRPGLLLQHRAFISLAHDEYYSLAMRNGVKGARDAGVNLIFLGANAIYRHIRLASSPLGRDRMEIDYKNPNEDPLLGIDNADVTPWAWRDSPNNKPESTILGGMWKSCNSVQANMVITDPRNWIFAGTGLTYRSRIKGIVGPEFDSFSPGNPNPGDVTVLARSPVICSGHRAEANMTYYSAPSGAGVWDTGTLAWVGSLQADCPTCTNLDAVTTITANVLAAFGTGPAGVAHPSTANATAAGGLGT